MATAHNVTASRHATELRHTGLLVRPSRHSRPTAARRLLGTVATALRGTWQTRGAWAPTLLVRTRAGLAEAWVGVRARPLASPAVLLVVAAVVTTAATTRPADLGSPRISPAGHSTPRHTATAQQATPPAPSPAPQCTVPTPPAPPAGVTPEQLANARAIAQVAYDRGLSDRAVVIALATSLQESKLIDIDYGDRDSLGLFQQRPSQGWGTPEQVQDPVYAAGKFYDHLMQVPGWDTGRLTDVAQAVQRSGYGEAYQQWEGLATAVAAAVKPVAPVCV
jgi:hypothetical protein